MTVPVTALSQAPHDARLCVETECQTATVVPRGDLRELQAALCGDYRAPAQVRLELRGPAGLTVRAEGSVAVSQQILSPGSCEQRITRVAARYDVPTNALVAA